MKSKNRILVIEDHKEVREGIIQLINMDNKFEAYANINRKIDILDLIKEDKPIIVIIGLSFDNQKGVKLIQNIKKIYPDLPIICISLYEEYEIGKSIYDLNCDGYIFKNEPIDKIMDTIKSLLLNKND